MKTMTIPSANGKAPIQIEKILDEELGDKCALYARVTIPAGSVLGYHEHHGNGESYYILSRNRANRLHGAHCEQVDYGYWNLLINENNRH